MLHKCDILYIHSTKNPTGTDKTRYGIMPMGIIAILNGLRAKGYGVLGINMAIETSLDESFSLQTMLENTDYKVLLTDLHWYEHSFGAMYVAEQSKKVHPHIPVVVGGYTTTIYGKEILENFPAVDFAVTGDSDLPLEMLIDHLIGGAETAVENIPNLIYRNGSAVLEGKNKWTQSTLDALDFVPLDFFHHAEYVPYLTVNGLAKNRKPNQWLCIARGCYYNCAYCCGAKENMQSLFGRCNVLTRSPEKVAADFIAIAQNNCQVSPSHDLQMFGKAYYSKIFEKIRESGQKPGMYLELFQLPSKDFIDEVEKTFDLSNTTLEISPISGNEKLRKENGKLFSNEQLCEIVKYIVSKNINAMLYYTANVVGETKAQFEETLSQMQYMRTVLGVRDIFYQRVVIDPLAPMRKLDGVNAEYNSFMDYYRYCQIPHSDRYVATGFTDCGELPLDKKVQIYTALFAKRQSKK